MGHSTSDPGEVLGVLARRSDLLSELREGPLRKQELTERHDVSRSTVDRAVRELEAVGFVTRSAGAVQLTLSGELALTTHERHVAQLDGIDESVEMLAGQPSDLDLDPALFRDATVVAPDRHAPHRPVDALLEMLARASSISLYATGIMPEYVHTYRDVVLDGATLDCICTTNVLRELLDSYGSDLTKAMVTGRVTLHETPTDLPFSLIVAETDAGTEVCLMFYRNHSVAGFVQNDTPGGVEWATNTFADLLDSAETIRPPAERE